MKAALDLPRGVPFFVETESGQLSCRVDGNRSGPSIVFSNSHATDMSLWASQVSEFADGFNIIRYDQRGHGATPTSGSDVTFDTLADDVISLLDALRVDRAVLVGVSMGAVTALRCAARHAARVDGVVASDGQWMSPSGARQLWQERIDAALNQGMKALVEPTVRRWFSRDSLQRHSDSASRAAQMVGAVSAQGYVACAQAMLDYDHRADYPNLAIPVQYIVGAEDGKLPEVMREMHSATPDSRFDVIARTGHLPCLETPVAFNALLRHFLVARELALMPRKDVTE